MIDGFNDLGFLDQNIKLFDSVITWEDFTKSVIQDKKIKNDELNEAIQWLNLFSKKDFPKEHSFTCNFDVFCHLLQDKLSYNIDERDMAFLHHKFVSLNPKTGHRRTIEVSLCEYGEIKGFSAMARTVGIPVAVAAWNILEKEINAVGVKAPLDPLIYNPILKDLPFTVINKL